MAEIIDYPDSRLKATRRSVLAGAIGAGAAPPTGGKVFGRRTAPFPQDPIIALIADEDRWRSMAVLTREKAEKAIASLPEQPRISISIIIP